MRRATQTDKEEGRQVAGLVGAMGLTAIPLLAAGLLVLLPAGITLWRALGGERPVEDPAKLDASRLLPAVGRTFFAVGLIAGLATLLAVRPGWLMRRERWRRVGAFILVPMLLPNYFTYAGWSLLRAPGTLLGNTLAGMPAWVGTFAAHATAVAGLALWSWPLAALTLGVAARRLDQSVLDALALDAPSGARRVRTIARMLLPGLVTSFLLVCLVTLGSMTPLDVASLDTYSVALLRWVNEHPSDLPVWRASWPLLLIALGATLAIMRSPAFEAETGATAGGSLADRPMRFLEAPLVLWTLSVLIPVELCILNLRDPPHAATLATIQRYLMAFWRDSGGAVVSSLWIAARTGGVCAALLLGSWFGASWKRAGRRATAVAGACLLFTGLIPGVLIGAGVRHASDALAPGLGDSSWIVVFAHLAQFAFVGVLLGIWLAGRETRDERDLRRLDGGDLPVGFAHACMARHWGVLVGGALAVGLLSFHEVYSCVILTPPGYRSFSQEMLDALHFARDERLAAATVNLIGVGVVVAYLAAWLMLRGSRSGTESARG